MVKIINQLSRAGYVTAVLEKMAAFAWVNRRVRYVLVMGARAGALIAGELQQ